MWINLLNQEEEILINYDRVELLEIDYGIMPNSYEIKVSTATRTFTMASYDSKEDAKKVLEILTRLIEKEDIDGTVFKFPRPDEVELYYKNHF